MIFLISRTLSNTGVGSARINSLEKDIKSAREKFDSFVEKLTEIEGKFKLQKCSVVKIYKKFSQLKICDNCVKSYSSLNGFFC
jgi:hypothetical protein